MDKNRWDNLELIIGNSYMAEYVYTLGSKKINYFIGELKEKRADSLIFEHQKRIYYKNLKTLTGKKTK